MVLCELQELNTTCVYEYESCVSCWLSGACYVERTRWALATDHDSIHRRCKRFCNTTTVLFRCKPRLLHLLWRHFFGNCLFTRRDFSRLMRMRESAAIFADSWYLSWSCCWRLALVFRWRFLRVHFQFFLSILVRLKRCSFGDMPWNLITDCYANLPFSHDFSYHSFVLRYWMPFNSFALYGKKTHRAQKCSYKIAPFKDHLKACKYCLMAHGWLLTTCWDKSDGFVEKICHLFSFFQENCKKTWRRGEKYKSSYYHNTKIHKNSFNVFFSCPWIWLA